MAVADRTLFEIYREADYARQYRVVYFTELDEHNKDREIDRALAGEHFYDGFLPDLKKARAKTKIQEIVNKLNEGEALTPRDVEREIARVLAETE